MTEKKILGDCLFRLHLNNNTKTDWFDLGELTWMVKKNEGRIITIEKKENNGPLA